jgi:deoxyribodipyrimidine photo-lyase
MSLFDAAYEPPPLLRVDWTPTRAAGLARLEAFLPHAGRAYARDRNVDRGPEDRANVSALSPWIRRRLVTEEEVIAAVMKRHSFAAAEKFIQEVFWRSYWKGWLEMRPGVLHRFDAERKTLRDAWAGDKRLGRAMEGKTGIACFDAWVRELVEIGWVHNHARMWFASIWIYTLRLPWQLGADFFYKHLLDVDPASNTLSWRWVAGLHTRGKHYLARASNIRDNTGGRFDPAGQLDERAAPLSEDFVPPSPSQIPHGDQIGAKRIALLLTEEDLHLESWKLNADVAGCGALALPMVAAANSPAARFNAGALEDGLTQAAAHFGGAADLLDAAQIVAWAKSLKITEVATAYAPTGLVAWSLNTLQPALAQEGIRLVRLQRGFDARVWPHAKAGFFKLKEKIPTLIAGKP